jgi:hypothetical protein
MIYMKYVWRRAMNPFLNLTLHFLVAFLFLGSTVMTSFAQEKAPAFSTTLSLEEDPVDGPIHIRSGDTVYLNGTISRSTDYFLNVDLSLRSNRSEGGNWILLNTEPGRNFTLSEPVRYQFEVRLLNEGSYYFRPWVTIEGSPNATLAHPIDADSPACPLCAGLGIIVVVEGEGSINGTNNQDETFNSASLAIYASVAAVAAGGGIAAFYVSRTRKSKHDS